MYVYNNWVANCFVSGPALKKKKIFQPSLSIQQNPFSFSVSKANQEENVLLLVNLHYSESMQIRFGFVFFSV